MSIPSHNPHGHGAGGHVPVGTGRQLPYGHGPATTENTVVVVSRPDSQTVNAVTVHRGGEPARQIPAQARNQMRSRAHYVPPQTPTVVHVIHQPETTEVRQIPGTDLALVTKK